MRALVACLIAAACAKPTPRSPSRPGDVATAPTGSPPADAASPPQGDRAPVTPGSAGAWRSGPGSFPLPADADAGTRMLGDDVTFLIPRERDVVYRELLGKLAAEGYVVDDEQLVLGGHRMHVHRDAARYFVSVTENGTSTLMTITVK